MGKIGRIPNDPTILYMILPFLGSLYDPKRFCNVPSVKKKEKKKERIRLFWFPRAPYLTPLPIIQSTPFLSLAGHSHSCSPFLFLFQSTQHTYTHSSPSPSHRYIPQLIITSTIFPAKSLKNPQEHNTFT